MTDADYSAINAVMTPDDLRAWRAELGLSQVRMAQRIRVPRSTWISWEQGRRPMPRWLGRMRELDPAMVNSMEQSNDA